MSATTGEDPDAHPIRVLHVDDAANFVELAASCLEREDDNLTVETATSAEEGLERLDAEPFDCVVSDYEMPGRNGIEFLDAVRETDCGLPFILFTGKGSEEIASEAISAGVSDYLQKGSGEDRYSLLVNRIRNLVARHRAEAQLEARVRHQDVLSELGNTALVAAGPDELLDEATAAIADALDTAYAHVLEYQPTDETYVFRAGVGWAHPSDETDSVTVPAEPIPQSPLVVGDADAEEAVPGPLPFDNVDVSAGVTVPIRSGDELWGVLGIAATHPSRFSTDELLFLEDVATVLAAAIDRWETEAALRAAKKWSRRILEQLSDHVIIVDGNGTITYCSPAIERQMGYTPEEVIGDNAFEYVHPDDQEVAAEAFAECLEHPGTDVSVEYRSPAKDGSYRWIEVRGGNYLSDPVIEGIIVSVREVTDRKESEQQRRAAQEWHQALFEGSRDAIFISTAAGTFADVNEAACELTGYDRETLLGMRIPDLHDEGDLDTFREYHDRILDGEAVTTQAPITRPDGSKVPVEFSNQPITVDGETYVHTAARDVSEREARTAELERNRTILQRVEELAGVGGFEIHLETGSVTWTAGMRSIFEVSPDFAPTFETALEFFPPDQQDRLNEAFEECRQTGERQELTDIQLLTATGNERWVSGYAEILDGTGEPRMRGYLEDITQQRATEERLREQNKRLEEFASIVSHELRTPISIARGQVDLALADGGPDGLEAAVSALDRMQGLIDELLVLARAGDAVDEREPVSLQQLAKLCWAAVGTSSASLAVKVDEPIEANPDHVRQLLENLFRNAIEHAGEDVSVELGGLPNGFYVEDDGSGIPPEDRDRVFEVGYTTGSAGAGLGLRLVEQIVQAHGWEIAVTEGTTGGARFEITGVTSATS